MIERARTGQTAIGLAAAATVIGGWLAIHAYAMFVFTFTASSWPFALLIMSVQCWLSVGMFIVAHDAMHRSLAPRLPRVNAAVGAFVLFLYAGFGWQKLRDAHFDHHDHAGTERDPDFHACEPRRFWPWYRQFLWRYFGAGSMVFVWSVVLTYFFVLGVPPANILFLYGIPAIASSMQLFYFGTYRPHRHEGDARFPDRHNARSNDFGTLASLFSCFHFGYHHEHHLSPGTPWWGLPARHAAYRATRAARQEQPA